MEIYKFILAQPNLVEHDGRDGRVYAQAWIEIV